MYKFNSISSMNDFWFVLIGLNTVIIFMFKTDWLFNNRILLTLACINAILFVIPFFYDGKFKTIGALQIPLFSLLLFYILYQIFFKIYKRNPENTFWTLTKKPIEDVLFSILFWIIGIALPVIIFI